jgi:hypothetical protein
MKSEMVAHLYLSDDVEIVDEKFMKDGVSEYQKFREDIHQFHALFSTRLSHLGLSHLG